MRKIIMASITAVVVIAVLAGTLIPVLDDATATERTFVNTGYNRYSALSSSDADELTIVWDHTDPLMITVNGVDIAIDQSNTNWFSLVFGQTWSVRYHAVTPTVIQYIGSSSASYIGFSSAGTTDMTITASAGTMTISDGTSTYTESYTDIFYPDASGAWIMKNMNGSAYVSSVDSVVYANGSTSITTGENITAGVGVYITGTVDDGVTVSYFRDPGIATSDLTIVCDENDDYDDLIELEKITFNATVNSYTTAVTYSYFLVPYEVTAEKTVHFTDGENAILNAIPVIVIIALLLAVVAIVLRSRMD